VYSLLIVDDEPFITDGLHDLFAQDETLDLYVFKAYSGQAALQTLDSLKVDILLTDMKMPGMSGLSLKEEAMQRWSKIRVIFLTAYSEFDSIYAAVKSPNVKYILKDEEDEVIREAVIEAIKSIEEEQAQEFAVMQASRLQEALPLIKDKVLRESAEQGLPAELDFWPIYKITLQPMLPFLLFAIHSKTGLNAGQIRMRLTMRLGNDCSYEMCQYDERTLLVWLQPSQLCDIAEAEEMQWTQLIRLIHEHGEALQGEMLDKQQLHLAIAMTGEPLTWADLPQTCAAFEELFALHVPQGLYILHSDEASTSRAVKLKRQSEMVEQINEFMLEHINKDLSLVKISEAFYINPSYLSRIYKQWTGKNVSAFLAEAKIRKAKELLIGSSSSINHIAAEVGFDTSSSFIYFFRKHIGMTPQQYRQQYACSE